MIFRVLFSLVIAFHLLVSVAPVHAATSLLPSYDKDLMGMDCDPSDKVTWVKDWQPLFDDQDAVQDFVKQYSNEGGTGQAYVEGFLACGVKTGNVHLWMAPYFITFALEFLINLSGLISILMIVVGAYFYIAGGITDDKDQGKTIIQYAVLGLVVTTVAWVVVNLLLLYLTA